MCDTLPSWKPLKTPLADPTLSLTTFLVMEDKLHAAKVQLTPAVQMCHTEGEVFVLVD